MIFPISPMRLSLAHSVAILGAFVICHPSLSAGEIVVPDWALPSSPTHKQIPPPADFHRPTVTFDEPIGIFEGQSDVGGPLLPGKASLDKESDRYEITSASYNVWYTRDEMRFLWKRMEGDISLAADISFPKDAPPVDRKVVLVIRQDLDDDAKEVMVALHGPGLIHLAYRPAKGARMKETHKFSAKMPAKDAPPIRLGIEKRGDTFTLFASLAGGPMEPVGASASVPFKGPFYVGIGFCSHIPDKLDTGVASRLVLDNAAGKVR